MFAKAFKSQPDALSELLTAPAQVVESVKEAIPVEEAIAEPVAPTKPAKAAKTPK
ncbi:hypothetical protein D3C84_1309830 [compost metagenome]